MAAYVGKLINSIGLLVGKNKEGDLPSVENGSRIMLGLKEHIVPGVNEEETEVLLAVKSTDEAEVVIYSHCG